MLIGAVVFDLDDTLYEQATWLEGAWSAVADAIPDGVSRVEFHHALVAIAAEGSDRGRIIDRALERVGASGVNVTGLVRAFRQHAPATLPPYPGVIDGLQRLRGHVPVGLVTDGDPSIQRAKLAALGLEDAFDAIVFSDELGREHRKPQPAPFLAAAERLNVSASECVFVGDRPDKDIVGAMAAGYAGAVRVLTGEYRDDVSEPCPVTFDDIDAALRWIADARTNGYATRTWRLRRLRTPGKRMYEIEPSVATPSSASPDMDWGPGATAT